MKSLKTNNQIFPVIIEDDEKSGYVVTNPAIEGCYTQGETIEEALENIKEATELCMEELKSSKKKVKPKNISFHFITAKHA